MSATLAPQVAEPRQATFVKRRPNVASRWSRRKVDLCVFAIAFAAYFALGAWLTLGLHLVYGDAESRLAHAYFVWWNHPQKLSAIGFVWPPMLTTAFVPLALVKPLATSLLALPLFSALVGAALVTTLVIALRYLGMPLWQAAGLSALFAIDPIVVAYATNGMSEIAAMWILTLTIYSFIRWSVERTTGRLVVTALLLGIGALVRYEVALLALVLVPATVAIGRRRLAPAAEAEANVLTLLTPLVYGLGLWSFINWTILGQPLQWVHEETSQTFVQTREEALRAGQGGHISLVHALSTILGLDARLFPALFAVAAGLVVLAVRRRGADVVAPALAAAMLLDAATSVVLSVWTQTPHLFELRFSIHALPLAVIGIGWLYRSTDDRRTRLAIFVAGAAGVAAALPLTWHAMTSYDPQLNERAFIDAITTGRDQDTTIKTLDPLADLRMAHYVTTHVHRRDSILADDAQTFGVILRTGRPDLFVDRVDHGDAQWLQVAEQPYGHVRYLLLSNLETLDLFRKLHPDAYSGHERGLRLAYATPTSRLFRVVGPVEP